MIKLIVKAPINEQEKKDYAYDFDQPVITIGRLKENDIPLPLSTISGFHSQILKEGENYYLMDRGSVNGTFLNGQRLVAGEKKLIRDGDVIRIQTFEIYFSTGVSAMNIETGATVQVARQMVMEVLGAWESKAQEKPRIIIMGGPNNGRQFELAEQKSLMIGREANCDIQVEHPSVSRRHAEVTFTWSGAFIKDLNSSNGVFVNDQQVPGGQRLHDRDMVRVGQQTNEQPILLVFSDPAEALLAKIEDRSFTDSNPPTDHALSVPVPPVEQAGGTLIPELDHPEEPYQQVAPPAPAARPQKSSSFPVIPVLIGFFVLLLILAGFGFLFFLQHPKIVVERVDPAQGFSGQTIGVSGAELDPQKVESVLIYEQPAPILKREDHHLLVKIPEFRNITSVVNTEVIVQGKRGIIGRLPFRLVAEPALRSISPQSGRAGTEVRVSVAGMAQGLQVFFGDMEATMKPSGGGDLVALVPKSSQPIPPEGLSTTVTVRSHDTPVKNSLPFTILPEVVPESDRFALSFTAKPFPTSLGFNEYAVETNLGPLLVLVSRDEYGTSRDRAENVAANLNDAVGVFQRDPTAKVELEKEGDLWSLVARGSSPEKRVLLHVLPEDALAYGKINGRVMDIEELAQWWQMLLDAYYKVFAQVADPANTGILATGGTIFQQIFSFYPVEENGQKFFKRDLPTALTADQKSRLIKLSLNLPRRFTTVEGKWTGLMSNSLYTNISEKDLELVLTLRQNDNGSISGNAEINWKIIFGQGTGGFQNVALHKLGIFGLSGTFNKTKTYPVEFSFVEKDGRRLNFVGKLDGDILGGSFVVGGTGEEGSWTVRLGK